jgi:hypothetical protein
VSGKRVTGGGATPFAEVMGEQGMRSPVALEHSIREALGDGSATSAHELLTAAERLLDRVLAGECESRDSALDLLTVDALVTKAMEIAARDPDLVASFPELAMKRISAR